MKTVQIENGYIIYIADKGGSTEVPDEEYNRIAERLKGHPAAPSGFDYKLRADTLEWELVELPPEPEDEPTVEDKAEAYDILMGVSE